MKVLEILCVIMFEGAEISQIIRGVLIIIGLAKLFDKCGLKWQYALIPCYRYYIFARCAAREAEGRILFSLNALLTVVGLCSSFYSESLLVTTILFVMTMVYYLYEIRVLIGITEVFARKKRWAFLWMIATFIVVNLWGWSPKFQPQRRESDIREEIETFFSNAHMDVMQEGLTVNLEKRTVSEFMQKKTLLRDVHMYIQPGHMVLLLGGSGAGKTTLLNAINGYEQADAEIWLNGRNIYKEYKDMQYQIGFVPQQDLMRGKDTVWYTLANAAALRLPVEFTRADRVARVETVMDIFGLKPVKDNLVEKLSGGQRKRLSIAMEFLSNPSLFILDEPDSGLDGVMARELMEQLRLIADQGKIVIVITHTPDRVIDLFDDVIVLAKDADRTGRLAYFGPIGEAKQFFEKETMETIVRSINRTEEGGEGRADEFIRRFAEVQHG
ncbi:MAG: ATP-binding cassette domain-containing protein [Clostridia bacterium]|nr:ATP-binding cassette domain-containing protein [Clostridia bacterium]